MQTDEYSYYCNPCEFFSPQRLQVDFCWSLSDSKFPQVSKTILSILCDFNNPVIGMVSIIAPIAKSFEDRSQYTKTGITAIRTFHSFFRSRARSKYLSIFHFLLSSLLGPLEWQNPLNHKFFFLCVCYH